MPVPLFRKGNQHLLTRADAGGLQMPWKGLYVECGPHHFMDKGGVWGFAH